MKQCEKDSEGFSGALIKHLQTWCRQPSTKSTLPFAGLQLM